MGRKAAGWLLVVALALTALAVLGTGAPGASEARPSETHPLDRLTSPQAGPSQISPTAVSQQERKAPEANLPFLFAVYAITWLAFFGYAFYLSRRQAELRREIQALREDLEQRRRPPGQRGP